MANIVEAIGKRDAAACFCWTAQFAESGADLAQFARELAQHVRNLYVMSLAGADVALDVSASERRQLEGELALFGPDRLARMLSVLGDAIAELKTSTNPRLSFEIACTRMVRPEGDLTLAALAERVEKLERAIAAGVAVAPAGAAAPSAASVPAQTPASAKVPAAVAAPVSAPASAKPAMPAPAPVVPSATSRPQANASAPVAPSPAPVAASAPAPAPAPPASNAPAPAPTSAPASSVPSSGAPSAVANPALAEVLSNPAALQRSWQAAVATLKRSKAAYGVLFLNTKVSFDAARGMLAIDFPAGNAFAFKAVQKPDIQEAVASALAQACACPVPFVFTIGGKGGAASAPAPVREKPAAQPARPAAQSQQPMSHPAQPARPAAPSQPRPAAPAAAQRPAAATPAPVASRADAPAPARPAASPSPASARPASGASDVPPWEDEQVPYGDMDVPPSDEELMGASFAPAQPAVSNTSRAPRTAPAGAPAPRPAAPASANRPAVPVVSPATEPTPSDDKTPDDLQAILQAGFGGGVTFEEVTQ